MIPKIWILFLAPWKSRRKCRAGEDNKRWSIIHPRVPELNHKRAHLSVSSKMTHVASGCEPHSPGNAGCLRCHPWLMESRGTQRGNMEDSGSHTAPEAISKWAKKHPKTMRVSERRLHTAALVQVATYSTFPPSYQSPPSCSSWRHLGRLVFQCDPVAWVCLKSFFGGLISFYVPLTQMADSSWKMDAWAAEQNSENQRPSTDLDRKTNPRLLTSTHVEAPTCSCTWISDNAALTWSHCHCFTMLRLAQ